MCVACRRWHNLVQTRLQRGPLALQWSSVRTVKELCEHTAALRSCAFAPDGGTLVTVSDDDTARVWATGDWSHLCTLSGHTGHVYLCVFATDGGTLVTVYQDRMARLWDTGH